MSQLTSCLAADLADDGITVLAFGPAAPTGLARSLCETEAMPEPRRQFYETYRQPITTRETSAEAEHSGPFAIPNSSEVHEAGSPVRRRWLADWSTKARRPRPTSTAHDRSGRGRLTWAARSQSPSFV